MYIAINDIIGEARIDLSYPIKGKKIAVVSMFSNNAQIWLQRSMEVLLNTGKKIVLNKRVYTDEELNSLIGMELKLQMLDSPNDVLGTNNLCTFQFLGGCQGRRTGVEVTTVSNSLILGGWVTKVLKNDDEK